MPLESTIVASIVRVAKSDGWWVMKIHGGPYQLAGVPDLLCLKDGRALFLEVKQPGKKPTALQVQRMHEIERVGGATCRVVTSKEEANAWLRTDKKSRGRKPDDPSMDLS
jgi:Holliday junction resolvase